MTDYIIIAIVTAIVGFAAGYVYKVKKSGKRCIGCPDGCSCSSGQCSGGNGCNTADAPCCCKGKTEEK